jgi:uncharacterized protein (TIGR02117 family)
MKVQRIKQSVRAVSQLFFAYLLLYFLIHFLLSRMTVSHSTTQSDGKIEVLIMKSGVHTDFVLPINHALRHWKEVFPVENTRDKDTNVHFISIGWGDENFYLNTPTWFDLTPQTALSAVFGQGRSAIHAFYYYDIPKERVTKKLFLNQKQYQQLIQYIDSHLRKDEHGNLQLLTASLPEVMYNNDAYYAANGTYNLTFTCNTWVNEGLKSCGQKACLWTAFGEGIFYQYAD